MALDALGVGPGAGSGAVLQAVIKDAIDAMTPAHIQGRLLGGLFCVVPEGESEFSDMAASVSRNQLAQASAG